MYYCFAIGEYRVVVRSSSARVARRKVVKLLRERERDELIDEIEYIGSSSGSIVYENVERG